MRDLLLVGLITVACAGGVVLAGALVLGRLRSSLRTALAVTTLTTVLAVVAGVVGTASAMFLSAHDLQVVLLVCVVATVVALIAGVLMGRRVVREARALQDAARALAEGEAPALPAIATVEMAAIGAELVSSAERLAASRHRAQALDASRRELVAWVSHDLRTPLAGLRAMAEALEDGVAEDAARYHRQMRLEVDKLASMVDDLFELSRIQAGALTLRLEPVSLGDVLSDVVAGTRPLAQARRVHLGLAEGPADPTVGAVVADPRELSRALTNLVVNAIRHTPADGTVQVAAELTGDAATLSVQDACGGIADADIGRVFDLAWRGTPARTPGPDHGAGLGLAIVRGIVEAHHGSVTVRNVGAGCRFEVRLPSRTVAA